VAALVVAAGAVVVGSPQAASSIKHNMHATVIKLKRAFNLLNIKCSSFGNSQFYLVDQKKGSFKELVKAFISPLWFIQAFN